MLGRLRSLSLATCALCAACGRVPATMAGAGARAERAGAASRSGVPLASEQALARPAGCQTVAPGELAARVAEAPAGAPLCLEPGTHPGPLQIAKPLTLWGPRSAVVRSRGPGTVIAVTGAGARLLGFTIDARGGRYDEQDAAVAVRADDVTVRGLRIENAVFGILSDRAKRITITDNDVQGQSETTLGMRGDGVRLWETYDSLIARNRIADGRDLVVWYSERNRFEDNASLRGRYGTHFMHASDNVVRRSNYAGNVVGIFVMYSHRIRIEDSMFVDCSAAGSMGIGIKDSGDVRVQRNRFVRDTIGVYIDNSPSSVDERDLIEGNRFQLGEAALVFHGGARGNVITLNDLAGNREQVRSEGGGDARDARWSENRYDDYAGYDLDGDGRGDVAYEIRSLSAALTSSHPSLAYFRGTPAYAVIEALGRMVPLFAPRILLVDPTPRLSDPVVDARGAGAPWTGTGASARAPGREVPVSARGRAIAVRAQLSEVSGAD